MNFLLFCFLVWQSVNSSAAFDIKGRLDLKVRNVSRHDITRTYFNLYRIRNPNDDSDWDSYSQSAKLENINGEFTFSDVPIDTSINRTTYFTLHSHSNEFNLKPNRILIQIVGNGQDQEPSLSAFENRFGREYFPSPDITYPETLNPLPLDSAHRLTITTMNKQPYRKYIKIRNPGILESGPIASVLRSKFKLAGVVTVIFLVLFPILLEKFDPETAKAMRQEKMHRENAKYVSK
ncbi:Sop4 [Kluyveromyces lactis]|nr:Sop4 [Kluyveromyces lactis]